MLHHPGYLRLILLAFLGLQSAGSLAQKNDTVYLNNGDRITGELKRYEGGLLVLSTTAMSTINIEYDKIGSIHSSKYFEIETKTGFSYFGSILRSASPASIDIVVSNDTVTEPITSIVKITQIRKKFWKKFYGSADLGLSYNKSSDVFQWYLNGDLNYRSRKYLASLNLNTLFTDNRAKDSADISKTNEAGFDLTRFLPGKWLAGMSLKAQQNTELNLQYRYQVGLGAGYDIISTNPVRFYTMAGAIVNRERPMDTSEVTTNFEGIVTLNFVWRQYRHPKINISSYVNAYPSFTVAKRIRLECSLSTKYEIVNDLYLNLTLYDNYDNKPSGGGPELNDWGVTLSLGYSF